MPRLGTQTVPPGQKQHTTSSFLQHSVRNIRGCLQAAYEQIDFSALEGDIADTQEVCALTQSPIVFGHNDLLSGNILVLQQPGFDPQKPNMDGPICIIDYEYGGYTYRGFDIGNHFTEYAGFEGDYSR